MPDPLTGYPVLQGHAIGSVCCVPRIAMGRIGKAPGRWNFERLFFKKGSGGRGSRFGVRGSGFRGAFDIHPLGSKIIHSILGSKINRSKFNRPGAVSTYWVPCPPRSRHGLCPSNRNGPKSVNGVGGCGFAVEVRGSGLGVRRAPTYQ